MAENATCPTCGAEVLPSWKACPFCAASLRSPRPPQPTAAEQEPLEVELIAEQAAFPASRVQQWERGVSHDSQEHTKWIGIGLLAFGGMGFMAGLSLLMTGRIPQGMSSDAILGAILFGGGTLIAMVVIGTIMTGTRSRSATEGVATGILGGLLATIMGFVLMVILFIAMIIYAINDCLNGCNNASLNRPVTNLVDAPEAGGPQVSWAMVCS